MVTLFVITIFLGSALLFLVQPMFARMVLPLLGGSPSVWNTAMVFYQATLLGGYVYAHRSTMRLGIRRQSALQVVLLALPLALLPLAVPSGWSPPTRSNPLPWILGLMTVAVGLPFFCIATMSPLLQRWFTATNHARASDPYFLYAASNLGSILALLSYPMLLEPYSSLEQQSQIWSWGYRVFLVLAAVCAVSVWRARPGTELTPKEIAPTPSAPPLEKISGSRRMRWLLWSFVPSSLMLGVTNYLSSEVAVVPLLWIVPLSLYLLTFVFAFARREIIPARLVARAFPILIVAVVAALNLQATDPLGWLMLLHLGAFFVAALLCHRQLAADRPAPAQLTEFYLWLSIGGVLGGMFNALLAPLIFSSLAEYPIALVLACFVAVTSSQNSDAAATRTDVIAPLLLGLLTAALIVGVQMTPLRLNPGVFGLVFGIPALVCYFFSKRPERFAFGIVALFLAGLLYHGEKGRVVHAERSFFGVHRVTVDPTGGYHLLVHGKTLHGIQSRDPSRRTESLAYYHRTGPIGQVVAHYARDPGKRIGVIGLGVGSLASFAIPGQSWTFFEIDPAVERIARDARFFTFLRDSPAQPQVVLGDARQSLAAAAMPAFDLLVIDAYSSDAIPVHLLTREALALYREKLTSGGILAFHISNQHLDLEPVLAQLAHDAQLTALMRDDTRVTPEELAAGKSPSIWLVLARRPADLAALSADTRWRPPTRDDERPVWTDSYSSVMSIFHW